MRYFILTVGLLLVASISFLGKRSDTFVRPPWQVFPDMDDQDKYLPQRTSNFFHDGRADRPVPAGVVHRGNEIEVKDVFSTEYEAERFEDDPQSIALYTGLDLDGKPYAGFPIEATDENFALGQAKYDLYCAVCHGITGDGSGPTKAFGLGNAASFHDPNRAIAPIGKPEGGIFTAITEGVSQGATGMVSFADRLSPKERWAVILHMRALQKARVALADVGNLPEDVKKEIEKIQNPSVANPASATTEN